MRLLVRVRDGKYRALGEAYKLFASAKMRFKERRGWVRKYGLARARALDEDAQMITVAFGAWHQIVKQGKMSMAGGLRVVKREEEEEGWEEGNGDEPKGDLGLGQDRDMGRIAKTTPN